MSFFDNCILRLHDSVIEKCTWSGSNVVVVIRKWDQTTVELLIRDAVYLQEQMGDDALEGLFDVMPSSVLDQAVSRLRALRWSDTEIVQMKHFQMLDLSAFPVLDVVGKAWEQTISDA